MVSDPPPYPGKLCRICGGLRELRAVPWCAKCIGTLHRAICSRPFGHQGRCDEIRGVL